MSSKTLEANPSHWRHTFRVPKYVANYNDSLTADFVSRLISDLAPLKENADSRTIAIQLSVDDWEGWSTSSRTLHGQVRRRERRPTAALEPAHSHFTGEAVVDLRPYLEVQRQIFDESA